MLSSNTLSFTDIRTQMLNNILWSLVVFAAIGTIVGIYVQVREQQFLLPLFYLACYGCVVMATAKRDLNYQIRAFVPVLILYGMALSEFILFGDTPLGFVFLFTLIIFSGLLYGFRASLVALALAIITSFTRFAFDKYQPSSGDGVVISVENFINWLSPTVAFLCCAAISAIAITSMLKQLKRSLDEKSKLVDDLTLQISNNQKTQKALDLSEEQLSHAQKMDAIGQLAGGIAHDFNNSLQAMLIFGETAVSKSKNREVLGDLENLLQAVHRSQKLVSQLLAFSHRQVLEMEELNLNSSIDESLNIIRRVIGDHIELKYDTCAKPLMVKADRTQVEQILLNLCINARDAIDDTGSLIIALDSISLDEEFCANNQWASSGDFVRLRVTDSGCGMDEVTVQRIFEPFFTTKEVGKGTGFGLSTVFGIVKQHNGFLNVETEIGKGTTMEVYLPQIDAIEKPAKITHRGNIKSGTETILMADDDELIRTALKAMLEMSGFTVLTACDGDEAIEIFEENVLDIDLVVLDVVMPNSSGNTVSTHISELKPDIPILFASGYSRDVIHTNFVLDEGINFIQKPFSRVDLLDKVRALIDSSPIHH